MAPSEATATTGTPTSGVPEVDAVLDSLAGLDLLPVEAHVALFERAHEGLRQALDGARGAARGPAPAAPEQ